MNSVYFKIPVLLILLVSPARVHGDEDPLKTRFLSEYPEALKAWESRTPKFEGTIKYTDEDTRKKTPHSEVLFSFKCKLPDMGVVTSIKSNSEGQRERWVSGSNKNYTFALQNLGEGTDFVVKSLEASRKSDHATGTSAIRLLRPFLGVPYTSRIPHTSLLSNPRFVVRRVSNVAGKGRNLLRVDFDFPVDPQSDTRSKTVSDYRGFEGFFLVSPEEKWALHEFECREKKRANDYYLYKGTAEYDGASDGFPNVKRMTRQTLKLLEGNVVQTSTYDFLSFRLAEPPDKDFTLTAFGIPEAVSQPAKGARSHRLGYWLLALAGAALAVAAFFKVAASRRRPSFPS